jgi:hypothetical protein
MSTPAPEALCDRCGGTAPRESMRTRLTIRPPGSPGPIIRYLCGPCAWSLAAWLNPPEPAEGQAAGDEPTVEVDRAYELVPAEGDTGPAPSAELLDVSRTI